MLFSARGEGRGDCRGLTGGGFGNVGGGGDNGEAVMPDSGIGEGNRKLWKWGRRGDGSFSCVVKTRK